MPSKLLGSQIISSIAKNMQLAPWHQVIQLH